MCKSKNSPIYVEKINLEYILKISAKHISYLYFKKIIGRKKLKNSK